MQKNAFFLNIVYKLQQKYNILTKIAPFLQEKSFFQLKNPLVCPKREIHKSSFTSILNLRLCHLAGLRTPLLKNNTISSCFR